MTVQRSNSKSSSRWLRVAFAVAVLVSGAFGLYKMTFQRANDPGTAKTIGEVELADVIQKVQISGLVEPQARSVITAPFAGYVRKIFVRVGQTVRAGDPLTLVTQTPTSPLNDTFPLRSPIHGKVSQVSKTEGDFVESSSSQGQSILRVDDLSRLFLRVDLPEMDFPKLQPGMAVSMSPVAISSDSYSGTIETIFQASREQDRWDRGKVEFPVRIQINPPYKLLAPGMTMNGNIVIREAKSVPTVRHEFVHHDTDGFFLLTESGARIAIEPGLQDDERVELVQGPTSIALGTRVRQVDYLGM